MNDSAEQLDDDAIDLKQLLVRMWQGRLWVTASVGVVTALFAAAAYLTTPIYRASTVLVTATADRSSMSSSLGTALGSLGGLASLAGINLGSGGSEIEEALAVLRSRDFTQRFIADRQLMPVLFASKWDADTQRWRANSRPPTPAQAYKYFSEEVRSVTRDNKTGLVTLHVDWRDRNQATTWANEMVQQLNAEMRARAIAKTDASVRYLEQELAATSVVATRTAISRLIETQVQQRMLANVSQEYAFRVIDNAMAPDSDDPIRPRKVMLLIAGPLVGFVLGVFFVFAVGAISGRPMRANQRIS